MYAVIRAGGRQHKVAKGDVIEIDLVKDSSTTVEFVPLVVVDDKGKVNSGKSQLKGAKVTGKVLGESSGDKVDVLKYRNKSGYRRHNGHRQRYTTLEITGIKLSSGKAGAGKTEK